MTKRPIRETAYSVVIGQTLANLRASRGSSQASLAARLDVVQSVVSRVETGVLPLTVGMLEQWSAALAVRADDVLRSVHDDAMVKLELRGVTIVFRRPKRGDVSAAAVSALLALAPPLTRSTPRAARAERTRARRTNEN